MPAGAAHDRCRGPRSADAARGVARGAAAAAAAGGGRGRRAAAGGRAGARPRGRAGRDEAHAGRARRAPAARPLRRHRRRAAALRGRRGLAQRAAHPPARAARAPAQPRACAAHVEHEPGAGTMRVEHERGACIRLVAGVLPGSRGPLPLLPRHVRAPSAGLGDRRWRPPRAPLRPTQASAGGTITLCTDPIPRPGAQAVCPEERAVAVETGAGRVAATLRWLRGRRFMAPAQLARFDSVVPAPGRRVDWGRGCAACHAVTAWPPCQATGWGWIKLSLEALLSIPWRHMVHSNAFLRQALRHAFHCHAASPRRSAGRAPTQRVGPCCWCDCRARATSSTAGRPPSAPRPSSRRCAALGCRHPDRTLSYSPDFPSGHALRPAAGRERARGARNAGARKNFPDIKP